MASFKKELGNPFLRLLQEEERPHAVVVSKDALFPKQKGVLISRSLVMSPIGVLGGASDVVIRDSMIFGRSIAREEEENGPSFKPEHFDALLKIAEGVSGDSTDKYVKDFRVSLLYLMDMKEIYIHVYMTKRKICMGYGNLAGACKDRRAILYSGDSG